VTLSRLNRNPILLTSGIPTFVKIPTGLLRTGVSNKVGVVRVSVFGPTVVYYRKPVTVIVL